MGVSTSRIHARGPVGLEGLMTHKWVLSGSGQGVGEFTSGKEQFIHENITIEPSDVSLSSSVSE